MGEKAKGERVPSGRHGSDRARPAAGDGEEPGRAPLPPPHQPPGEVRGPAGPEPTRYGDWEKGGRCSDF
jgi:hypothetical protein